MKKSLIALAMLGAFAGSALAQSNVTLYGILDVNYQRNDPNGPQSTTSGINSGHQSGSRWGLRGSEALGRGMNGIFAIEGGFGLDDGLMGQGNRLWGRQAWAGLNFTGANVSLVAGRLAGLSSGTGSFDMFGATDPFLTGFGDSALASTFSSAAALRWDNTVALVGGPWAGFRAGALYSFNAAGQEAAGSGNNTRVTGLAANYSGGPFFASVTHDQIKHSNVAFPGAATQKHTQIGLTFDLKFLKLHGGYAMEDNIRAFGTANSGAVGRDADSWMVGVTVPLGGGSLLASYQDRDADPVAAELVSPGISNEGPDLTVWAIGYSYPLSRRTNVYLNWSNRDGKGTNQNNATWDRKQTTVGVRHLF
jgi:general bacterial porin, GBP family